MNKKPYNSPSIQVSTVRVNDVISTSLHLGDGDGGNTPEARGLFDWDELDFLIIDN